MSSETSSHFSSASFPTARISVPESLDYHMIMDHELSQLSHPETGIIGSVGFAFFGAAVGLVPAAMEIMARTSSEKLSNSDLLLIGFLGATAFGAVICLAIFALATFRNRGLAGKIRTRAKLPVAERSTA